MAKLILMGLVEPKPGARQEDFDAWYLDNHVEDTTHCPGFVTGNVYKLERPFAGTEPAGYLTLYEIEHEDPEEAERILARYQRDPDAFPARLPPNGSLRVLGAGWYRLERSFQAKD